MNGRAWLVVALVVCVGAIGFGYERHQLGVVRDSAGKVHARLVAERNRASSKAVAASKKSSTARGKLEHALRKEREASGAYRSERAALEELLTYLGTTSCSRPAVKSVRPSILSPHDGATTKSPVTIHVIGAHPVFCDFTFHVTVDGVPYAPSTRGAPAGPNQALPMRATPGVAGHDVRKPCISGSYFYLLFKLAPGLHTVRIKGACPNGTATPATEQTEVSFTVRG